MKYNLIVIEYETVCINMLKVLENWTSWKFHVRITLKSCGAWEIVTDESVLPVPEIMQIVHTLLG